MNAVNFPEGLISYDENSDSDTMENNEGRYLM